MSPSEIVHVENDVDEDVPSDTRDPRFGGQTAIPKRILLVS